MKRYLQLAIMLLGLLALPGIARAQGPDDTLVVGAGQHIPGDVATVTQDIRVDGVVDGDVTSWSGAITIAGSVGGDVVSYGGPVTIAATGRVNGHILASGGALHMDSSAIVGGQPIRGGESGGALASVLDLFMPSADIDGIGTIGRVLFGAGLGVLLLAFCLLFVAFWPYRTATASVALQQLTGRALAIGLLTSGMLALTLLPVVALLAASLIGLPLLVALIALIAALYIYGLAVSAYALASQRAGATAAHIDIRTITSAVGLILLIAIVAALTPTWGLALFALVASPGIGAAILSRGGTLLLSAR
jgi:hypothetical protein